MKFYNGIDLQGQRAQNAADPQGGTDLATKQYVDNLAAGQSWKKSVRVATTTAGTLASSFENGDTVDGITLATGDRILIKDQASGAENGIYTVNASGAPTRATDADTTPELRTAFVGVDAGTVNGDKVFYQTVEVTTVGTTVQTWSPFGGGQTYSAGNGLQLSGSSFSVLAADSSITVTGSGISTSRSAIGATGKYAANLGALTGGTPATVNHALNSTDVVVSFRLVSTGEAVDLDWTVTDANNITVTSGSSVSSGVIRVVVIG